MIWIILLAIWVVILFVRAFLYFNTKDYQQKENQLLWIMFTLTWILLCIMNLEIAVLTQSVSELN